MKDVYIRTNYKPLRVTVRENSGSDEIIIREIFQENVYRLHDNFFARGGAVLDVGANIGIFTLNVLLRAKNNGVPVTVYAVEPEPHNLELLMANINQNEWVLGESNVVIINQGLGGTTGTAFINDNHGGSRVVDSKNGNTPIDIITLDGLVRQEGIDWVSFAKFDIESSEVPTILGASDETLDIIDRTAIEFDTENGLEKFAKVVKRFGRNCQINTLGVPARGCYIYTERFDV